MTSGSSTVAPALLVSELPSEMNKVTTSCTVLVILVVIHLSVTVASTSLSCPPGFVPNNGSCVCGDWSHRMIICDKESQPASISIYYCMTYDKEYGLIAGGCPNSRFRNDYHKFYYQLPWNVTELNPHVCGPFNTQGRLCGKCEDGYAVSPLAYFTDFKCVKCNDSSSDYGWAMYIGFELLPLTVAFLIIVVFGFSAVSGPVNAYIFYCQLTTGPGLSSILMRETMIAAQGNSNYSDGTFMKVVSSLYELWNLEFFRYFLPEFCLTKNLTGLHMMALQYVPALYPLFLVALLYLCIELHARGFRLAVWCWRPFHRYFVYFRRSVDPRASVIDAFATCTLLSYVKLLMISRDLLTSSYVYSGSGEKLSTKLLYYDTTVKFFHGEHLPFAILAILILLTFVAIPPVLLLLYPTSLFQKCLTRCRMNCYALHTFADIFQGCYKNGTNGTRDYRYFAGLYFLLRIVIVFGSLLSFLMYTLFTSLVYLAASVSFAFLHPHKKHVYNVVGSLIIALLAVINILITFHTAFVLFSGHPSATLLIVTDILYLLPALYPILLVTYWLFSKIKDKLQRYLSTEPQMEKYSVPDRMANSMQYKIVSCTDSMPYSQRF